MERLQYGTVPANIRSSRLPRHVVTQFQILLRRSDSCKD